MTTFALQTHDLVKSFGSFSSKIYAVNGLSLAVPEGSIYGFLGRNSAGKTTTIRMLMGLARPDAGSVEVLGLNPASER
jgi:ABC-2 type transport system ATP-binding protein